MCLRAADNSERVSSHDSAAARANGELDRPSTALADPSLVRRTVQVDDRLGRLSRCSFASYR